MRNDRTTAINSSMGIISAQIENDENYPGIQILVDGELVASVECCEKEKRLMIRNYLTSDEQPLSVDVNGGTVTLPRNWPSTINIV